MTEPGLPRYTFLPSVVLIVTLLCSFAGAQERIAIRGSDTLIYIGQRFADMYRRISGSTSFDIQGGGVDNALAALNDRQADVAQVEGGPPHVKGKLMAFPIGVQALVVYVNRRNPVTHLTLAQLRSIFLGEITNWKTIGGPDLTIHLYAGESTTGTLAYFQDSVLAGREPYPFVGKNNTRALLEEISAHAEDIGYGSLDSAPDVRAVSIQLSSASPSIEPTVETIRSRRYPITRFVTWVTAPTSSEAVEKFLTWVLSSEGQLVVEAAGFQPLLPHDRALAMAKLPRRSARSQPADTSH